MCLQQICILDPTSQNSQSVFSTYRKQICILNPYRAERLICFRDNKKGISTIRHLVAWIVEIPLFLGIFTLYLLTRDINTTVSTCTVPGNMSTGAMALSS